MSNELASPIRFAVSAFSDVNTRNILAVPRAWSLIVNDFSEESNSEQKLVVIILIKWLLNVFVLLISFCPVPLASS